MRRGFAGQQGLSSIGGHSPSYAFIILFNRWAQPTLHAYHFWLLLRKGDKGEKGIWNLDEIMMGVAMETVFEHGIDVFTIKPTGDRARYYRKKFGAETLPTTGSDGILTIDLKAVRDNLKHIKLLKMGNKTDSFEIKGYPDAL